VAETGFVRIDRTTKKRRLTPLAFTALLGVVALALAAGAPAQDLQSQLDQKRAQLDNAKAQEGVLSTTIQRYSDQIDTLAGQVATLRNREAAVQADLDAAQVELRADMQRLGELRVRLAHSMKVLRQRLVAIYRSSAPDVLSVILDSKGFDDLISRYQYLRNIEDQDSRIVGRVRDLRDEAHATVERVRALRNELAAKRDELARTRTELESRESALNTARGRKRDALAQVQSSAQELEGDISKIQGQIQAQIQAAQASSPTLPAGPIQGDSSAAFIWPVNGPITSPFCEVRPWESCHPGIDIGVPSGTPIRAAAAGTVILEQSEASSGGYGNFTCIDHGGGLSTCYAHQQSFAVSQGAHVSQGQVIGYSDCTGLCFGPHLHFEVRVNGTPVDPMGYL
jgi:murein DD-endopeptidase MepM/ murein hydrolase activator NlpD